MEESIAGLPIEDEEEETILLGVESYDQETFYANCFVGMFFTSSVVNFQAMRTMLENDWHPNGGVPILDLGDGEDPMSIQLYLVDFWMLIYDLLHGFMPKAIAKQLGSFIGVFLEYDALAIQLGYKRIMRLKFEYEKLTLFFFLCGKLGHGKSFCLIRALHPRQEYESRWLVEDDAGRISNYGNSTNKLEGSNLGISQPVPMNQGSNASGVSTTVDSNEALGNLTQVPNLSRSASLVKLANQTQ
ncbi:hypothetical protein Gogos_003176 [Gossypium gossypioides]|uniref:Zinc knuckle CX2CX4HX4C domain-containing protein n=1 Tax=Gossypium gossypioides TaxID=34282 RepID=A0A7J9CL58_GOSGO|nr:hypothetical protein [Gossypium gossypioides]